MKGNIEYKRQNNCRNVGSASAIAFIGTAYAFPNIAKTLINSWCLNVSMNKMKTYLLKI